MKFDFKVNPNTTNLRLLSKWPSSINEEIQAEILKDLRSNEQKAMGYMTSPCGARCCLCVMEDTLIRMEGTTYIRLFDDKSPSTQAWMNVFSSANPRINGIYLSDINDYKADLMNGMEDFDIKKTQFEEAFNVDIEDMLAKSSNISHKIIADLIEYTWNQQKE